MSVSEQVGFVFGVKGQLSYKVDQASFAPIRCALDYGVPSILGLGTNARWRDTVIGWCKKQTMRTVAHHLAAVLKTEMDRLTNPNYKGAVRTTETVAKRLCEILTLLEACGHTHDAVFMSTRKDYDAGYRLSLPPDYKPFLVSQISTGELFTIKN